MCAGLFVASLSLYSCVELFTIFSDAHNLDRLTLMHNKTVKKFKTHSPEAKQRSNQLSSI